MYLLFWVNVLFIAHLDSCIGVGPECQAIHLLAGDLIKIIYFVTEAIFLCRDLKSGHQFNAVIYSDMLKMCSDCKEYISTKTCLIKIVL